MKRLHLVALLTAMLAFCFSVHSGAERKTTPSPSPQPPQPAKVICLSAGYAHSFAVMSDGKLFAWGRNDDGQLGTGDKAKRLYPVAIEAISAVTSISAGRAHTLVLKSDGTVWAWGANNRGQLGNGTSDDSSTPVQVFGLVNIIAIEAGGDVSYAISLENDLYAWGDNSVGLLAREGSSFSANPVKIPAVGMVISISTAGQHAAALGKTGSIWTWGANPNMQLGKVTEGARSEPRDTYCVDIDSAISVSAGDTTVIVRRDGDVWVMGWNSLSLTGDGQDARKKFYNGEARRVGALTGIVKSACNGHTLVLDRGGNVWGWGENMYGQVGNGNQQPVREPVRIPNFTNVVMVCTGYKYSLALKSDGTVWGWGCNTFGQLGDATVRDRQIPVRALKLGD